MREVAQTLEEMVRWVEEAGWLEEVGQSPSLLPTQQLAQMAVEARPSASGEEPAQRKLCPTCQGQGPTEGVPKGREGKEDQEVPAWHSCPLRDLVVSEEH